MFRKALDCCLVEDLSWVHRGDVYPPCIPERKVLAVFREARDIRAWVAELEDPVRRAKALREYQVHRSEFHDIVTEASYRRKNLWKK